MCGSCSCLCQLPQHVLAGVGDCQEWSMSFSQKEPSMPVAGPVPGWESCKGPVVPHDETLLRIEIRHPDR